MVDERYKEVIQYLRERSGSAMEMDITAHRLALIEATRMTRFPEHDLRLAVQQIDVYFASEEACEAAKMLHYVQRELVLGTLEDKLYYYVYAWKGVSFSVTWRYKQLRPGVQIATQVFPAGGTDLDVSTREVVNLMTARIGPPCMPPQMILLTMRQRLDQLADATLRQRPNRRGSHLQLVSSK